MLVRILKTDILFNYVMRAEMHAENVYTGKLGLDCNSEQLFV